MDTEVRSRAEESIARLVAIKAYVGRYVRWPFLSGRWIRSPDGKEVGQKVRGEQLIVVYRLILRASEPYIGLWWWPWSEGWTTIIDEEAYDHLTAILCGEAQ